MKVFGLSYIGKKIPELLKKEVKHQYNTDYWNWTPHKPLKLKNIKEAVKKEKESVNYACITNYTPKKQKQNIVLFFSMGNLNYGLINNLDKQKIPYVFVDYT